MLSKFFRESWFATTVVFSSTLRFINACAFLFCDRSSSIENRFECCTHFFHSGSDVLEPFRNPDLDLQMSTKQNDNTRT